MIDIGFSVHTEAPAIGNRGDVIENLEEEVNTWLEENWRNGERIRMMTAQEDRAAVSGLQYREAQLPPGKYNGN